MANQVDVINELSGIQTGSPLAELRERRPETLEYAQGSFLALLEPDDPGGVSNLERESIALRVATLERYADGAAFHRRRLRKLDVPDGMIAAIELGAAGEGLSDRMVAILRHADLLTTSSRNGSPEAIAALKQAGLSARDIVTISQLIAYLCYQIRMIATLRAMGGEA